MKLAIIHDWLRVNAGSEKVIKEILSVFEQDDIELYTLFSKLPIIDHKEIIGKRKVHVTMLQHMPYIREVYQYFLPVLPFFMQFLKPKEAELYISSSHAVAKGFKSKKNILHICYCHTPMRYIWFLHQDYLNDFGFLKQQMLKFVIPFIRNWDLKMAGRVNYFIANSIHIQQKIKEIYHREAVVIYPPVQVDKFTLNTSPRDDFYLAVGRFVSYKKIDIVIKAFQQMKNKKLVLIGDGLNSKEISKLMSDAPNIVWLGYQHDDELIMYMQHAKACIFAAKEDFGIMCVEAQSTGTPVLALNYGGYKETVIDGKTGYFFNNQTEDSIIEVVNKFERYPLTAHEEIRENAKRFSVARFQQEMKTFTEEKLLTFKNLHE